MVKYYYHPALGLHWLMSLKAWVFSVNTTTLIHNMSEIPQKYGQEGSSLRVVWLIFNGQWVGFMLISGTYISALKPRYRKYICKEKKSKIYSKLCVDTCGLCARECSWMSGPEEGIRSLTWALGTDWVLWRSSKCSSPLSHLTSHWRLCSRQHHAQRAENGTGAKCR